MQNPWTEISLSDYENHMKLDSVMQLQTLNQIMREQFSRYPASTVMVLGVAGGNGLEHVDPGRIQKVYGVDVNHGYLRECAERYGGLQDVLECICADLTAPEVILPHAELVIANLLIEYIGYECFQNAVRQVKPEYVSCVIQINQDTGFVSDSPYLHAFDGLEQVHHQMEEQALTKAMEAVGYCAVLRTEYALPNGKALVRLDYQRQE